MRVFKPLGKKLFGFPGLLLLVIALPMAILITKHQQEIRQRAAGEQTNLFFAQGTSTSPLTTVSITPAGTLTLELYLNANSIPLSGFDMTITPNNNLVLSQITAGPDAAKFNVPIFANINSQNNSLRFSRVTTDPAAVITGLLHLATISFTASATQGTGSITFPSVLITSTTSQTGLTVAHAPVSYAIANPTTPTSGITTTPTPSPTPNPNSANLSLKIGLHGIGTAGDNANPTNGLGNQNPRHGARTISVSLFDINNNKIAGSPFQGTVNYNTGSGLFIGTIAINNLPTGNYQIKISVPGYLQRTISQIVPITQGQTTQIPQVNFVTGDIDNNNQIDILDYNLLVNCYGSKQNTSTCTKPPTQQTAGSDVDDDGTIDGPDYNLFIREISVQHGDENTAHAPTPTITPTPTSQQITHFSTLAPGSVLPSENTCATEVRRNPNFEPRTDNATANQTNVYTTGGRLTGSYLAQYGYESRVTGNFTGTTDETFQWAACKWGFDEDTIRAQAVSESYWHQSQLGDCGVTTQSQTNGCASVGILQVKGADIPATHPGTWPYARQSTAFNVDYTMAVRRACFEGKETWLGNGYAAGDLWGCIGRWFSGSWHDAGAENYISGVKNHLANKEWLNSGF